MHEDIPALSTYIRAGIKELKLQLSRRRFMYNITIYLRSRELGDSPMGRAIYMSGDDDR